VATTKSTQTFTIGKVYVKTNFVGVEKLKIGMNGIDPFLLIQIVVFPKGNSRIRSVSWA
jgi:hypothetical protein